MTSRRRRSAPKKPKKPKAAKAPQAPPKPPPKAPKSEPRPVPHARSRSGRLRGPDSPEGGSGFPDTKFMARNDIDESLIVIIQAKLDQSNGIDKGACAYCLFYKDGCPKDKRVGLMGACGRAHMGPIDRKPAFCIAAAKTAGLEGPLYLNNKQFWTKSLTGHSPAEAKPKGKAGGAAKGTPVPSEAEDDDDDEP